MATRRHNILLFGILLCLAGTTLHADGGRFDLTGPKIEVRVTRAGKMLPVASVPNLQAGDQIWLHPDLPPTQSVHYLLVAVFLRGTTNPPPDEWFTRIETWNKHVREEGVIVTVPQEAQQALLFLAPETGGDFATLRSAVRGRPGVFVRASQDLLEAGFEQARIEKYLASMKQVPPSDAKALLEHSTLLARTLNLKPNDDCFKRPVDQQYTCLTQTGSQSLLDDGHGQTIVSSLVSGPGSDFINAASATSLAGGGNYSAYVGAVVDLVRLTSGLHTAHYQYIPAIAFPQDQSLNLRLNTPPSFQNPKSVIVIGLPSVQAAVTPPLRPADPNHVSCLLQPGVVLPVEGAPLVFSTSFAHDLSLHINEPAATSNVTLAADPYVGGLVLAPAETRRSLSAEGKTAVIPFRDSAKPNPSSAPANTSAPPHVSATVTGTVSGFWGFDSFTGPTLKLQMVPGTGWKFTGDSPQVIAGQPNHLTVTANGTSCIQSVTVNGSDATSAAVQWKASSKDDIVDVTLTPKSSDPGQLQLAVQQFGEAAPQVLDAQTFAKPAELSSLELHAGDTVATLKGLNLAEVKQLHIGTLVFEPATISPDRRPVENTLRLTLLKGGDVKQLKVGQRASAKVALEDGRTLDLSFTVAPFRPTVTILSKSFEANTPSPIQLASKDDVPLESQLNVSLRLNSSFPRTSQIEIATADGVLETMLNLTDGSLIMQDSRTLVARVNLLKSFGSSAFGPLSVRLVEASGTSSDWLPLATLVRLPQLRDLRCPSDLIAPCSLSGGGLFLVSAFATDQAFSTPVLVPEGFVDTSIAVPHPAAGSLYLRLRDDPSTVNALTLPVVPQ